MRILLLLSLLALASCSGLKSEVIPPVEFEEGFSFEVPHGDHTHSHAVGTSRVLRVYQMIIDDSRAGEATGAQIDAVLEMIEERNAQPTVEPKTDDTEESNE